MARFPSDSGAGFLIGGFAQKMFEHQSKNTAMCGRKRSAIWRMPQGITGSNPVPAAKFQNSDFGRFLPRPARGGARQSASGGPKSRNLKIGGAFWLKSELFLTKIRIPNFKILSLGRAKRKGVGGKEFLPALAFRFQFFPTAAAEFRILLCEMRRQRICLIVFIKFGIIILKV